MEKSCEGKFCTEGKKVQDTKLGGLCYDCLRKYVEDGNLCGLCKYRVKSVHNFLCSDCSKWANKKEKKWYN